MAWYLRASCRGADTQLFFPTEEETNHQRRERERKAKAICANCIVIAECLQAGENEEGIWGGKSRSERLGIKRNRQPLERLLIESGESTDLPWAIIESQQGHAIWQRDSEDTWHGFEWAVVENGKIIRIEKELNNAYAIYGGLLQS